MSNSIPTIVASRTTTAVPGSPNTVDRYIIPSGAATPWTSYPNAITWYENGGWHFGNPSPGMQVYVKDEGIDLTWNGSTWKPVSNLVRVPVADVNYTISGTTNQIIAYTSITTARTITLPPASGASGQTIWIVDESASLTGTISLTIQRAGSDTIESQASFVLTSQFASICLESNGSNTWTIIAYEEVPIIISDANYSVLIREDCILMVNTLTAARVITLCPANTTGQRITIFDASGSCSSTNTLTISRSGTDTINGLTSAVLNTAYSFITLVANGSGKWVYSAGGSSTNPITINTSSSVPFLTSTRTDLSNSVTLTQSAANKITSTAQIILPNDPTAALETATKQYTDNNLASIQPSAVAAAIGPWTSYTPTWTADTTQPSIGNGTLNGYYRRVGDSIEIAIDLIFGSTTTKGSGNWAFGIPSGITLDQPTFAAGNSQGTCLVGIAGTYYNCVACAKSATTVNAVSPTNNNWLGGTVPASGWTTGSSMSLKAIIKTTQWTANVNLLQNFTEYLSCDGSAGVAANTAYTPTTIYGSQGSTFPGVAISSNAATTVTTYYLTPTVPLQSTDLLTFEFSLDSGATWAPIASNPFYIASTSIVTGASTTVVLGAIVGPAKISNTNYISVVFSNAGRVVGTTYAHGYYDWSSGLSAWRWRIRKTSQGNFAQGSPSYVSPTFGDGSTKTFTITHNLGVSDVDVACWEVTGAGRKVDSGITISNPTQSKTQITLTFDIAPGTNALKAIVFSSGGTITAGDRLAQISKTEVSVTSATTAILGCWNKCTATSANYTLTLPPVASSTGRYVGIRIDSSSTYLVTVQGNGAELIDGSNTRIMWAKEVAELYCDGTSWTKTGGKTLPLSCSIGIGANQVVSANTPTILNLNSSISLQGPATIQNLSTYTINIIRPGNYKIVGNFTNNGSNGTTTQQWIRIYKNGLSGTIVAGNTGYAPAGIYSESHCSNIVSLIVGDYLNLVAQYNGGSFTTSFPAIASYCVNMFVEEVISW